MRELLGSAHQKLTRLVTRQPRQEPVVLRVLHSVVSCGSLPGRSWRPDSQVSPWRFGPDLMFIEVKAWKKESSVFLLFFYYFFALIWSRAEMASVVLTRACESDPAGFPFSDLLCLFLKGFWHLGFVSLFKSYLILVCTICHYSLMPRH